MKEKLEFSLDLYQTGKYDVVTREDEPVEIKITDGRDPYPIVGYLGDKFVIFRWVENGRYLLRGMSDYDIFLVEKAEQTEQPFEDLEKAASLYYGNDFINHNEYHSEGGTILPFAVCEAWKAGVRWKEEKMMQKAISGYYGEMGEWGGMCISGKELDNADFLVGYEGPVKVIIIKEGKK